MEIITLALAAQEQARVLLEKESPPKAGLRVAVIGGGCSGLSYRLGWDEPQEEDLVHSYENGLTVFVDPKSALYLTGATLEFHNDLERSGFEVVNPQATTKCGCGKSFGV